MVKDDSASASVIPMNIQGLFPLGLTGLFDIITFEDQLSSFRASLVAQRLKRLPGMWETGFNPWVGKIPWRRAWQPTQVFLPGESPWTEDPGRLQSMGSQRVGHDRATSLSLSLQVKKPP